MSASYGGNLTPSTCLIAHFRHSQFVKLVLLIKLTYLVAARLLSKKYALKADVLFKDGAYYCYCAYVLRISRYSEFLSPVLTNTGILLRGLKLSG